MLAANARLLALYRKDVPRMRSVTPQRLQRFAMEKLTLRAYLG